MFKNIKFFSLLTFSLTLSFVLFMGFMVAYGGWVEPLQNPPGGNVSAPINTGSLPQSKSGSLILNSVGAQIGLGLYGDLGILSSTGKIGFWNSAQQNFNYGQNGQVLRRSGAGMSWASMGAPDFDSGWVSFGSYSPLRAHLTQIVSHNLGTLNTITYLEGSNSSTGNAPHQKGLGGICLSENPGRLQTCDRNGEMDLGGFIESKNLNTITIKRGAYNYESGVTNNNSGDPDWQYFRVLMWRY